MCSDNFFLKHTLVLVIALGF